MLQHHRPWIVRTTILSDPSTNFGASPLVVLYPSVRGRCGIVSHPMQQVDPSVLNGCPGLHRTSIPDVLSTSSNRVYASSAGGVLRVFWKRCSRSETSYD